MTEVAGRSYRRGTKEKARVPVDRRNGVVLAMAVVGNQGVCAELDVTIVLKVSLTLMGHVVLIEAEVRVIGVRRARRIRRRSGSCNQLRDVRVREGGVRRRILGGGREREIRHDMGEAAAGVLDRGLGRGGTTSDLAPEEGGCLRRRRRENSDDLDRSGGDLVGSGHGRGGSSDDRGDGDGHEVAVRLNRGSGNGDSDDSGSGTGDNERSRHGHGSHAAEKESREAHCDLVESASRLTKISDLVARSKGLELQIRLGEGRSWKR